MSAHHSPEGGAWQWLRKRTRYKRGGVLSKLGRALTVLSTASICKSKKWGNSGIVRCRIFLPTRDFFEVKLHND